MKTTACTLLSLMALTLSACSDNDNINLSEPLNDASAEFNANNYQAELGGALNTLRGEYFSAFIEVPRLVNNLFAQPLPNATGYFGPEPFPTGTETIACDSGFATQDITSFDAAFLTIDANFTFENCVIQGVSYNGQTAVRLDGDSPSRLGGQIGQVAMQFNDMEIKTGESLDTIRTLSGSFSNRSGWGAAYQTYKHTYLTDLYTETSASVNISIMNANYTQQWESDYYPDESRYYRLSESGALTLTGTDNQTQLDYSVNIDPVLIYSSQLNSSGQPVYDDNIASGTITFNRSSGGGVIVNQADSDTSMAQYEVINVLEPFTEVDEWLFPIVCNDNSPMNERNLCAERT